jgi:hypothetical protein
MKGRNLPGFTEGRALQEYLAESGGKIGTAEE